jgi:thiamine-phosphate pyrophosphorylase
MQGLPRLYLIADVDTARRDNIDLVDVVRRFVVAGGRLVSLRPGGADDKSVMELGRELSALLFSVRGIFLVHRRPDLALLLGAGGVHLPSRGLSRREVVRLLRPSAVMGRSCHDGDEVRRAGAQGETFVTLGPLFESVSKKGYGPGLGIDEFRAITDEAREMDLPVYALGGVLPENGAQCLEAGAYGLAVVGGILGADDVEATTREYLAVLEEF